MLLVLILRSSSTSFSEDSLTARPRDPRRDTKSSGSSHMGSRSSLYSHAPQGLRAGCTVTLFVVVVVLEEEGVDSGLGLIGHAHDLEGSLTRSALLLSERSGEKENFDNDKEGWFFSLAGTFAVVVVAAVGPVLLAIFKGSKECLRDCYCVSVLFGR